MTARFRTRERLGRPPPGPLRVAFGPAGSAVSARRRPREPVVSARGSTFESLARQIPRAVDECQDLYLGRRHLVE